MPKKNVNFVFASETFFFFKKKAFGKYMCVPFVILHFPFFPKARTLMKLMVNPPSTFVVNRYTDR